LLALLLVVLPDTAAATAGGDNNAVQQVMCNMISIMTGTTGKAIATVGIIALGTGALFGKISWNAAMLGVLSVGLMFGAASVVADLGGGGLALIVGTTPPADTPAFTDAPVPPGSGDAATGPSATSTCSAGALAVDASASPSESSGGGTSGSGSGVTTR
jgi:type IV secretory pathway VirB2 component (pilin)